MFVVAQSDVIGNFAVIADGVHGVDELDPCVLVLALLIENAPSVDNDI